jgi:hypothetical protein
VGLRTSQGAPDPPTRLLQQLKSAIPIPPRRPPGSGLGKRPSARAAIIGCLIKVGGKQQSSNRDPSKKQYGWMPHNAGFGFLDIASAALGQIHFLDRL